MEFYTAFHKVLAHATLNPIFELLVDMLRGLLKESQRREYVEKGFGKTFEMHKEILDEVKRHNSKKARLAMIDHITERKWSVKRTKK